MVLRNRIRRCRRRCRGRCRSRGNGWQRGGHRADVLAEVGRREEMACERRLLFLGGPLFFCIGCRHRHRRRRRPGIEDRPAEVARQRRAKLWNAPRQLAIVAWQTGEPVRRRAVVGVVEFGAGRPPLRLQGEEQGDADPGGCDDAKTNQHPAG